MKIFLTSLIFVATFITSFLFWPEFGYAIGCGGSGANNEGCSAVREYDTSDWRLHGGLTWFESHGICTKSGDDCIPVMSQPERYGTNFGLMLFGSLGIAVIPSFIFYTRPAK